MSSYLITAVDHDGKKVNKLIDLENEAEIFTYMDHMGLDVLNVRRIPGFYHYLNPTRYTRRIRRHEIIEVLENLTLIIKSGLPTNTGLMDLARDSENPKVRDMLSDIGYRVQMGMTLSRAMEKYAKTFSDTVLSLIRIGEETGDLDNTLADAAEHMKKIEDLKSKAKQALIYPSFAFVGLSGAMLFWLIFVMPQIIEAFASFDMELPATTRAIMAISGFLRQHFLPMAGFGVALVMAISLGRRFSEGFRFATDRMILKVPLFASILKNFNFAFFAEYTRLMISAGLPLYHALNVIERALGNMVFRRAVVNARESIAVGRSLADSLNRENLFPALVIRMITVGEQTGRIEEQLNYVATFYYTKVDALSQNIAKMIEPLIIVFVGLFMLLIMLGLLGPVYSLLTDIGL